MWFQRKRKAPKDAAKKPKLALTPESLKALHESQMLTPMHRRLFGKAMARAMRDLERAKDRLQTHDRTQVSVIPLTEEDRVWGQVGVRRSLTAVCLFGLPLVAVALWAFHHGWWAVPVLGLAGAGVWTCKRLDITQVGRLELNALEQKALRTQATSDPTAREVYVRWKQVNQPFTQQELQLVEDWLSGQNEVRQWKASERLLKVGPRVYRSGRSAS